MTRQFAQRLLLLQVLLLLIGTQMPGAWRAGIEGSLHAPFGLSSWAHFVLFGGMAWVANAGIDMAGTLAGLVLVAAQNWGQSPNR